MSKIVFIGADAVARQVEGTPGVSVMEAAIAEDIPGIDADCGGNCACGTCHIFVDPGWFDRLPAPDPAEADLLDSLPDRKPHSRLSCQVKFVAEYAGLTVTTPKSQH